MNIQTAHQLNRNAAEQLLCGSGGVSNVYPLLADLIAVAAAAGRPHELASEHAILAAFRVAWLTPAPRSRRLTMLKTTVLKLLTVKAAAAAAVATVAGGGVALAASTGALPNPLHGQALPAASAQASDPAARHSPGVDVSEGAGSKDSKGVVGSPSPSLVGLCHAYSAGNKTEHGKALDNPAFTALVTTAGGRAKVDGFCQTVLASAKPIAAAGHDSDASASPDSDSRATDAPADHPTGAPSGHPTGAPTDHPTGKPSALPTH